MKLILVIFVCYSWASALGSPKTETLISEPKITNGFEARRDQFAYHVSISWNWLGIVSHVCGGSILTPLVVITSAECLDSYGRYHVTGGILNLGENTLITQERDVEEFEVHPNWSEFDEFKQYNVALLKLASPFKFRQSLRTVRLPVSDDIFGMAIVSGWGITEDSQDISKRLRYANVKLLNYVECNEEFNSGLGIYYPLDETVICTSGAEEVSACDGDFGGPLVQDGVLLGVASWNVICEHQNVPTVYSNVIHYVSFIQETVRKWSERI